MKRILLLLLCLLASPATAQIVSGQNNVTPFDCSGTITAGGTAQNIASSRTLRGLVIMNIDTTEGMWINFNATAAADTAGSYFLGPGSATAAGGSFSAPLGFGYNTNLSIIAATTGHKFTCTRW